MTGNVKLSQKEYDIAKKGLEYLYLKNKLSGNKVFDFNEWEIVFHLIKGQSSYKRSNKLFEDYISNTEIIELKTHKTKNVQNIKTFKTRISTGFKLSDVKNTDLCIKEITSFINTVIDNYFDKNLKYGILFYKDDLKEYSYYEEIIDRFEPEKYEINVTDKNTIQFKENGKLRYYLIRNSRLLFGKVFVVPEISNRNYWNVETNKQICIINQEGEKDVELTEFLDNLKNIKVI